MWFRICAIFLLVTGFNHTASAGSPEAAAVMQHVLASTAQVVVERAGGGRRTGSAIAVAVDERQGKVVLVTAAHVLTPVVPQNVVVTTPLHRRPLPANVLALDVESDLALIEVSRLDVKPVAFSVDAMLGDGVWVAAFPWGGRVSVVGGVVSQISWRPTESATSVPLVGPVTLIDATVSHGMSGGGVFDRQNGTLLGIVRSYRTVQMTLPGEPERAITFPVGGETTIVPSLSILCFLANAGHSQLVPAPLRNTVNEDACRPSD